MALGLKAAWTLPDPQETSTRRTMDRVSLVARGEYDFMVGLFFWAKNEQEMS
jgi:hypothetical protein